LSRTRGYGRYGIPRNRRADDKEELVEWTDTISSDIQWKWFFYFFILACGKLCGRVATPDFYTPDDP
jgi:hypothetical protein